MNVSTLKIKLFLFSLFLLGVFTTSLAQETNESGCGTIINPEALNYLDSFQSQIKSFEEEFHQLTSISNKSSSSKNALVPTINSIPIKAHIIRNSEGNGGLKISELQDAIDNLNAIYADAFLEFFLCDGINYINSDNYYYDFEKSEESQLTKNNFTPNVINIYFTDYVEVTDGNSLCGYSNTFGGPDVIVLKNDCATNGSTLAHEMGHFFSLLHTHGNSNTKLTTELVDGSNCDTDGDQICDTPADPQLSYYNVNSNCEYTGCETDANGDPFTPDTRNIMSYSNSSCKSHFSPQQLARIYAFYKSARNYFECPSFYIDITADINQECGESLTVNFSDHSAGAVAWQWDVDGDGVIDYTTQNPTHTFTTGIYDVTLTISKATNLKKSSESKYYNTKTITKTFPQFIKVGSIKGLSLNETFDDFEMASDFGWTAIDITGNGYNWYSNSGKTVTNGTGPAVDNSNKTSAGTYIYAEASGAQPGDVAEFVSPCLIVNSNNAVFNFNYYMYGKNIGSLHIDIETTTGEYIKDVIPAIYGEQQTSQNDPYITQTVDLSAYANKIINIHFRAVRGASWDGDIAIDDASVSGDVTIFPNNQDTPVNIAIYPNPVNGDILYVKTNDILNLDYEITNLVGQQFAKGHLSNSQINVSDLSQGSYFLVLLGKNHRTIKRFIK
ncbi:T9SS-dependent choice-of-anchor J family protein [Pseudalgibacter alginicilyticus]|nr:T9SS type A sorting domain-containing protein [Pseudalgibacter alginicilyticus]